MARRGPRGLRRRLTRAGRGAALRSRLYRGLDTEAESAAEAALAADGQGRFAWEIDPPAGGVTLVVSAAADRCSRARAEAVVPEGKAPPRDLRVEIHRPDLVVAGTVRDVAGAPVAGARVRLDEEVATDAAGSYELVASSQCGMGYVLVRAAGYAADRALLDLRKATNPVRADFQLRPELVVRGRVRDENGTPVPGAVVRLNFAREGEATSDAEGCYELRNGNPTRGSLVLEARKDGYVPTGISERTTTDTVIEKDLVLERGVRLEGRVRNEASDPVGGAHVGATAGATFVGGFALSAPDGRFVIKHAPRRAPSLNAGAAGFVSVALPLEIPAGAEVVSGLEVMLSAGRSVAGRVVGEDGEPLADVSVSPPGNAGPESRVRTDTDGEFALNALPAGEIVLHLSRRDLLSRKAPVGAGETEVLVTMRRAGTLRGRVVDGTTGEPIAYYRLRFVVVLDEGGKRIGGVSKPDRGRDILVTAPDGRFAIEDGYLLEPGRVLGLEAEAPGYAPAANRHVVVELDPPEDAVVLALYPGRRVAGRVVAGGTGAPVAGALVRRHLAMALDLEEGPGAPTARTDADGAFALDGVPPGEATLVITHPDFEDPFRDGPFPVPARGPDVSRLVVLGVGGSIEGTAEPGARIVLTGIELHGIRGDLERTAVADARGAFHFLDLPDGRYRVDHVVEEEGFSRAAAGMLDCIEGGAHRTVRLRTGGSASIASAIEPGAGIALPPLLRVTAMEMGVRSSQEPHAAYEVFARDGRFSFPVLPPGDYLIGVSFGSDDEGPGSLYSYSRTLYQGTIEVALDAGESTTVTVPVRAAR
ncbi:MAG: carboxypeptidase-like regulatory domain-containing protein [Planctomycetota bacterium]